MGQRDEIMQTFGPLLKEAIALVVFDEINSLRAFAGLTPRTTPQLLTALTAKLQTLQPYDWMELSQE